MCGFRRTSASNRSALGLGLESQGSQEVHISATLWQICALPCTLTYTIDALGLALLGLGLRQKCISAPWCGYARLEQLTLTLTR